MTKRRKLPAAERRSEHLRVRLTKDVKRAIVKAAAKEGLTVSAWVLKAVTGRTRS